MTGEPSLMNEEVADSWPVVDIIRERLAQREEYGDAADDALLPAEWVARLVKHLGRAVSSDPEVYRRELVVCGALVVAALDALDRSRPSD